MRQFAEIAAMMTSKENKTLNILSWCETKLKYNKSSNSIHINEFHPPFQKDNNSNGSGGILVKSKIR